MLNFPKWKIFLTLLVCFMSIVFVLPNFISQSVPLLRTLPQVNLGLDLRGGSHLLLKVDFNNYLVEQLEIYKDQIRTKLRNNKIGYKNLKVNGNNINFSLRTKTNDIQSTIISHFPELYFKINGYDVILHFKTAYLDKLRNKVISQSIEIVRRRIDKLGTKEPILHKQGLDGILLQVPGLKDPENLKKLLGTTAKLTFHLVEDIGSEPKKFAKRGQIILSNDNKNIYYVLKKRPLITGDLLTDAKTSFDNNNHPAVAFTFNRLGAKKFANVTRENRGQALAIVLDNKVISAPTIDEPIIGGSGIIRGNFTVKNASNLALLLRAGALPAPIKIVEERTVGPTLGSDSINSGKIASLYGLAAVMLLMIIIYGNFGIIANIALIFNMSFIIAVLSLLQATLTLPGIAGIVLTMGMAVDANVLIFERMREEIKTNISIFKQVDSSFKNAFSTIIDSNLTTIFAALCLYFLGDGVVKGFAVTLIIGILTSMYSAITLTRMMIVFCLRNNKLKKLIF